MTRALIGLGVLAVALYYGLLGLLWGDDPASGTTPFSLSASPAGDRRGAGPGKPSIPPVTTAAGTSEALPVPSTGPASRPTTQSAAEPVSTAPIASPSVGYAFAMPPGDRPGQTVAPVQVQRLSTGELHLTFNYGAAETEQRNLRIAAERQAAIAEMRQDPATFATRHGIEPEDVLAAAAGERDALLEDIVQRRIDESR